MNYVTINVMIVLIEIPSYMIIANIVVRGVCMAHLEGSIERERKGPVAQSDYLSDKFTL